MSWAATSGVVATRRSPSWISLGTPILIILLHWTCGSLTEAVGGYKANRVGIYRISRAVLAAGVWAEDASSCAHGNAASAPASCCDNAPAFAGAARAACL